MNINSITPINKFSIIDGIDLRVKRDDLFPRYLGGNKARKIIKIGNKAIKDGYNVLVTNGGVQSNHCRATSLFCAENNLKCRLILHTNNTNNELVGNYLLSSISGAEINFTSLENLSKAMDDVIEDELSKGNNPLYIWGGGHCLEGSLAYFEAFNELKTQCEDLNWYPDYIIFPSGTGTTHAGIHVGNEVARWKTKIIGISVSRKSKRGTEVVTNSCNELRTFLSVSKNQNQKIYFLDNYICGGYEDYNTNILETIIETSKKNLILDPTYSGKAFWGLLDLVKTSFIPRGAKVLFWHTGGIYNLLSSNIYKNNNNEHTFN